MASHKSNLSKRIKIGTNKAMTGMESEITGNRRSETTENEDEKKNGKNGSDRRMGFISLVVYIHALCGVWTARVYVVKLRLPMGESFSHFFSTATSGHHCMVLKNRR